jgi:hypothetical protein
MKKTKNILVYRYEYWDVATGSARVSESFATFDAILRGFARPIPATAKMVVNTGIFHELVGLKPVKPA